MLSDAKISELAGIDRPTISLVRNRKRNLPEKHLPRLLRILAKYGLTIGNQRIIYFSNGIYLISDGEKEDKFSSELDVIAYFDQSQ